MEKGFQQGQSDNLPKVDSFMVAQYFSENSDHIAAKMRGVKMKKSGRDGYGDEAIGYVQLKRDGDICTVKCRMTPEHRVRVKPYHCTLLCNEKENVILSSSCDDCAARTGGCKYSVAFLMWLHRRTEEPSATSVKCYWKKSTFSSVGSSLKFIKAKDFKSGPARVREHGENMEFLSDLKAKIQGLKVDCQLSAYFNEKLELEKLSMHYMICEFRKRNTDLSFENFLSFCKIELTEERCKLVQNATIPQSETKLWYEKRYGRVTASKAYEAAHCQTSDGSLVEEIFGAKAFVETEAIKRGKLLEGPVRNEVARQKRVYIKQTGLVLKSDLPFFCASPDGMILSEDYIIEIKCPSKSSSYPNYYKNGKVGNKFYAQMQTQMHVIGKEKGLFCIAQVDFEATNKVDIYEIQYNKVYCDDLFKNITKFWRDNIYPRLLNTTNHLSH